MHITLLGTGTSTGVPEIACNCDVCEDAKKKGSKNNRTRSSILLHYNGKNVLIDPGMDMRTQMLRHNVQKIDAILATHSHQDHVGGMDDIRPFNYKHNMSIPIYANEETVKDLRHRFHYAFKEDTSGSTRPRIILETITKPFDLFGKKIIPLPVKHGKVDVFGFRIDDFVYLTDYNFVPDATKKLMMGTTTIVISAIRRHEGREHPTHATVEMSEALVKELKIKNVYYTHITHSIDHRTEKPAWGSLAFDGLEFDV